MDMYQRDSDGRRYVVGRYGEVLAMQEPEESNHDFNTRVMQIDDREQENME